MKCIASAVMVSVMLVACSEATGVHPGESLTVKAAVSPGDIVHILVVAGDHAIQGGTGQSITAGLTTGTHAVPECTGDAREYPIQQARVRDPVPTGPGGMEDPGSGPRPNPSPTPGGTHQITMTVVTPSAESLPPGTRLASLSLPSICIIPETNVWYEVFSAIVL